MSSKANLINKVTRVLKGMKGVRAIYELTQDDRKKILELEKDSEKNVLGGLGKGLNVGVREVLKREVVMAFLHDENYEWPPEPVQLICMGEVVGEEIRSREKLEKLKEEGNVILLGDTFAIYKDKFFALRGMCSELIIFLFRMC